MLRAPGTNHMVRTPERGLDLALKLGSKGSEKAWGEWERADGELYRDWKWIRWSLWQYEHQQTIMSCGRRNIQKGLLFGNMAWMWFQSYASVRKCFKTWSWLNSSHTGLPVWPKSITINNFSEGKANSVREI